LRIRVLLLTSLLAATGGSDSLPPKAPVSSLRSYNGTNSAGGFLIMSVDPVAHTLTYTDPSNGDNGVVPFLENSDGVYELNDPEGTLLAAYEVPNYGLLVEAKNTGPDHDALAVITAIQTSDVSVSTWAGHEYNYMQFRTTAGGIEVGSASIDARGNVSTNAYWPFGALGQSGNTFHRGGFNGDSLQKDDSGTFLRVSHHDGDFDYVFGTASGIFALDTPNGALLGFKKARSKDFDPLFAGAYKAFYYQKTGATPSMLDVETGEPIVKTGGRIAVLDFEKGTPRLGSATVLISTSGEVTVEDAQGKPLVQAILVPVADTSYLYGTGEFKDPCFGLFTFRVTTANSQEDVFVSFLDRAVLFSSFKAGLPWKPSNTYDYLYGVGLK
jgi:hypothetical protein